MTPSIEQRSAARILDLAESRGSRSSALIGFALILLLAAHAALSDGFPTSAQAAAMSPAGARIHARESAQMNRLMAISAAAVVTAGASAQNAVQWRVEDGGNGHWYQAVPSGTITWTNARLAAEASRGELVSVETAAERQFVFAQFSVQNAPSVYVDQHPASGPNFGPWIGGLQGANGSEPFGGWRWLSGVEFDPAEPACCNNSPGCVLDEDCLHLYWYEAINKTSWNDLPDAHCGVQPIGYVVEWSADCNADGIVDYGQIRSGDLADANANNIPDCCESGTPCNCAGDTNNDGFVDGIDLATILTRWAQPAAKFPNADCNRDGVIDGSDLSIVLGSWGVCP